MKYFRFIILVLFFFTAVTSWSMGRSPGLESNSPLIGKTAPDEILPNTEGQPSSIIQARKGKKAIMIFWATWCPHCYDELGTINNTFSSFGQKGISLILVDIGETKDDVVNYFQRRKMILNSFIDENSILQEPYRLQGVPTLIFIDENGIIRSITHELPADYEKYFNY